MKQCPYRPLGTLVILKALPIENKSGILLPDGKTNPQERQTFEVIAVGGQVNDEKYSLTVGEIVLTAGFHPSEVVGLDKEEQWFLIDRSKILVAIDKNVQN